MTTPKKHKHNLFTISLAPTSRAKCKACSLPISKGSIRVSRDVASILRGDKDVPISHHYHLTHGMAASIRVRCPIHPKYSCAPHFAYEKSLTPADKVKARTASKNALDEWKKRCKSS